MLSQEINTTIQNLTTNEKLFNDSTFSDVTLIVDNDKKIKVHSNILSSSSPIFSTMLFDN